MKNTFVLSTIFIFLFTPLEISISLGGHTRFLKGFAATVFAETSIKAEVDKTRISTDEILTYKLIITSTERKLPAPQVPKFEGFAVVSQAQSSTITSVKSNIKTILVYAFILAPIDIGRFKIGPSLIKIKNKTYSTDTFEIEVTQGKVKPKVPAEKKPSVPEESLPESEQPQITL